jgi:hypothetical protein
LIAEMILDRKEEDLLSKFADGKEPKTTEKMFVQGLIISIISILLCVVALCSASFAWFNETTQSNGNVLTTGSFELSVAVTGIGSGGVTERNIEVIEIVDRKGTLICTLPESGQYRVTLTLSDASKAKGHCIVTIGGVEKRTETIIGIGTANKEEYAENSPLTFIIETSVADTVVEFSPVWGVVAQPDLEADKIYSVTELWK